MLGQSPPRVSAKKTFINNNGANAGESHSCCTQAAGRVVAWYPLQCTVGIGGNELETWRQSDQKSAARRHFFARRPTMIFCRNR